MLIEHIDNAGGGYYVATCQYNVGFGRTRLHAILECISKLDIARRLSVKCACHG